MINDKKNIAKLIIHEIKSMDILILFLAILFCGYLFKFYWFNQSTIIEFISVQVSNQPIKLYPAAKHQKIKINGVNGESLIEIKYGKARFLHSHCLNQLCVLHGWIKQPGESIVCLPNQISLTLVSRNNEFDALNF